jgi:acid phosphatase family membrane protein YuiD
MNPYFQHNLFKELAANRIFIATILAWIIVQTIKVLSASIITKKFDFRWFIGTGGMPSAHAAGATAMAIAAGLDLGFTSPIFTLAVVFALVTMFDAQGVRRSAGKQAEILNKIMDDMYWKGRIEEKRLAELLGHTPFEVIIGSLLGAAIALACYTWIFK